MCFVGRVGHGAGCDAARESNHDENRDSVCVLPWYAHRRVLCTTQCSAMCKRREQGEREGRCERYKQGVCVWAGWHSTMMSRDCNQQQQHQRQLDEHQQSGGCSRDTAGFWNDLALGRRQRATGTGAALSCEVPMCQLPERPRSDFVACRKASDAQIPSCARR